MITLDQYLEAHPVPDGYVLVRILADLSVAWDPKDYKLRKNDIVHVPERLAAILIQRGIATQIRRGPL